MGGRGAERGPAPGQSGVLPWLCAFSLTAFVCAIFSAAGAVALLLLHAQRPEWEDAAFRGGLWVRLLLFGLIGMAAGQVAWRGFRRLWAGRGAPTPPALPAWSGAGALAAVLLFGALLAFPNLRVYPRAAPDEVHHLNVAKNLALHGRYASGNPREGFVDFDSYDSVGPPVILPIAAAFLALGVSVEAGRVVMGMYFLGFLTALWLLLRPVFGGGAAAAGAGFAAMAISSIYLGRTLYGEVPAWCYFLLGLALWRRALDAPRVTLAGLGAGVLFGLALLCKAILLLTGFCFLGAVLADWAGARRIRLAHLAAPAAGSLAVLSLWSVVQRAGADAGAAGPDVTLNLYRHYLLFGVEPIARNLAASVFARPVQHLLWALVMLGVVPQLFLRRYDPPLVVLWLAAVFFGWWWTCFTPGQLPRYLWYSYSAAAGFTGVIAWGLVSVARTGGVPGAARGVGAAAALLLLLPPAGWAWGQAREIAGNREMEEDYALAAYVREAPGEIRFACAHYPLRAAMDFLADRSVPVAAERPADWGGFDLVIAMAGDRRVQELPVIREIGPYRIVRPLPWREGE